jgi:hypothetical protein
MPHVVDIEEKQPFIDKHHNHHEDGNEETDQHVLNGSSKSQQQHHINVSCYGNGDISCNGSGGVGNGTSSGSGGSTSSTTSSLSLEQIKTARSLYMMKLTSALFYAVSSFLITVVNKVVLTSYK